MEANRKFRIWIAALLCIALLNACSLTQTQGATQTPASPETAIRQADAPETRLPETKAAETDEPEESAPPEEDLAETVPAKADPPEDEPPESEAEDLPPEEGSGYSALVGIWFGETTEVLTVFENGGFLLQTDADHESGYLQYTEEQGTLWDPVPRYEMVLENGERLYGDEALSLDEGRPGMISYTVGGGAMLFGSAAPGWSTEDGLVQARYPSGPWIDCTVAEVSDNEPTTEVLFTAAGEVKDFRILSLFLKDVDQEGNPEFLIKDEYRQETLPMGWPVIAVLSFYGDIPNCGICYTDANGETHYYALSMSGYDGSLALSEF